MESKAKLFGHPIHPMLIVFPLGLLITAVVFDMIYFVAQNPIFGMISFWNVVAGLIGGVIAAIFGTIDWLAIPDNTRAKSIGLWHGIGNGVVILLFGASMILRLFNVAYLPDVWTFMLALLGMGLGTVTAWLGGELIDRLGVGVSPGAHLNSPSSLSGEPADAGYEQSGYREREVGGYR